MLPILVIFREKIYGVPIFSVPIFSVKMLAKIRNGTNKL